MAATIGIPRKRENLVTGQFPVGPRSTNDPKTNGALPPRERLPHTPDGEAAKMEETQQQAEHKDDTKEWGTRCSEFLSRFELPAILTARLTVTRSARLG